MTNLSEEQDALLTAVALTRGRVEDRLEELENEYAVKRYDAEAPLRQAILEADLGGVPRRRIHLQGLDTKDAAVLKRYLPQAPAVEEETVKVVGTGKVTLANPSPNIYVVTDSLNRTWEFWGLDFDGHLVFERSQTIAESAATFAKPVPYEVSRLLEKKFPKADFTTIEKEAV